ncbi:sigma-54 interaction domain-containing protein [Geomesophilobacter sediminis]|uniref:sigma-54 interaction domain-containing protein n=1 Tax=Geomesophilobacter sediminis TaxID=2798584 RepID=UPI002E2BE762|nr:sigma 54-interacting transcriptional regulator [Geomesophilobacter sediminis]
MGNKDKSPATAAGELRQQAEKKLRATAEDLQASRAGDRSQRLSHELEVHQIELEMQNLALRQAQQELELSLAKYAELFDFAPVGYFAFDASGVIREVNLAGARLLGINRSEAAATPFASYIADPGERARFTRHLADVLHEPGVQRCEIRLTGTDGKVVHWQLQSVAVGAPGKKGFHVFCSVVDGTLARELKAQLQKAHDNLECVVGERTEELTRANAQLTREIDERKRAEESLKNALAEIKGLKDRLLAENIYLRQEAAGEYNFGEIVGQSKAITHVFTQVKQVAPMDATVLLLGETGTGKGVVARAIHSNSSRKDRPMITVNCTALPGNLIESELFGREKGAFTGANAQQIGRFELAHRGTIFLDEIGEMPLELQCKLLRVIQDGEFERLGSPRTVKVDVRIIAASNKNLEEEVRNHRFREDLFYRLNVFPITIPPLRQRTEDIPRLVEHFIAKFNKKNGKKIQSVSRETLKALQQYQWPGNVRELESVVERAVITTQGPSLQIVDRFDLDRPAMSTTEPQTKALAELEYDHILGVLLKTGWRIEGKNGAAGLLGLNPSTLRARMRKCGIQRK